MSQFRPIQLSATPGGGGFPTYGCALANLGTADVQSIMPGPLPTPASDDRDLHPGSCNSSADHKTKMDRFRFDAASTGYQSQGQSSEPAVCISACHAHDNHLSYRGSQGNLLRFPYNSCTSIAQNLSTSDQQPLIVSDIQNDQCQYHYLHNPNQSAQPSIHQQHTITTNSNNNNNNHLNSTCCLETTSFMAKAPPTPLTDCTCSHQTTKSTTNTLTKGGPNGCCFETSPNARLSLGGPSTVNKKSL